MGMCRRLQLLGLVVGVILVGCDGGAQWSHGPVVTPREGEPSGFVAAFSAAALERTRHAVRYDPSYRRLGYPGGDVPAGTGVCSDVVIRSYRRLGIDLQVDVHEDMSAAFDAYPKRWGLTRPDPSIDHRRVPNLEVLFRRHGHQLPVGHDPAGYLPGDLVTWDLGGRPHIGIVVDRPTTDGARYLIVHNVGAGTVLEDVLFAWPVTGHYRYYGSFRDR